MPSRASVAGNSVVSAVEEACALYGVRCYRQQSRAMTVVGAGGRPRPMFVGQWRDRFGTLHTSGMADLLLTPFISQAGCVTALWVECKSGTGKLTLEQQLFRDDVQKAGAYWLQVRDSADQVLQWFDDFNVVKR
jgi:hypothetical protein